MAVDMQSGYVSAIVVITVKEPRTYSKGAETIIRVDALAKEHLDDMAKANTTHGMTGSRLYCCYKHMMNRCYRQKDIHYKAYGGRGIAVCDEWKNDSKAFINWALANGYSDDLTIERIDVNGNYEPSNCTWIPMSEQYDNKRQNVMLEWNGERHNATYWSRVFGIPAETIRWRCKHGWSIERIFELPKPYKGATT